MRYWILISGFIFTGCTTLTFYQPTGLQEIPEIANTDPGKSIDAGMVPTIEYAGTQDASTRPFKFTPSAAAGRAHFARVRFPIKNEDIEFAGGLFSTGGLFGSFKYQFWGPKFGLGVEGDTSFAFVGQASISAVNTRTGSGKGEESGGYPWEAKISGSQAGGALLFGWRLDRYILFYGGPYASYTNVEATVNQGVSSNQLDRGSDNKLNDYFIRYGPSFGTLFKLSPRVSAQIEGTYLMTKIGQPITVDPESHVAVIFRWDDFLPPPEKYY
jgi:hypothetical protein